MSETPLPAAATILVVEDHPIYRKALAELLRDQPWVGAVVEAGTIADAVRLAVLERADMVLMDIRLPDGDGIAVTPQILRARPQARVVILTANDDEATVAAALGSGASGYLIKNSDQDDVVLALHTVWRGGIVLGPHVEVSAFRAPVTRPEPFDRLNEKELALVCLVVGGASTRRTARSLDIAEQTVHNRLSAIYKKLGLADRAALMVCATKVGLVCPPH